MPRAEAHRVALLAELVEAGRLSVEIEGRPLLLVMVQGEPRAYADYCPHAGASLAEGTFEGDRVTCAWHGWSFDLKTGRCRPYPSFELFRHEVTVDEGWIWVRV